MTIVTEYPLWLSIFCVATGVILAWLLYFFRKIEMEKKWHTLLFTLRTTVFSILTFLLLEPLIKHASTFNEKPIIVVLTDNSASIVRNKDSLFYKNKFPELIQNFETQLKEKFDVRSFQFSSKTEVKKKLYFSGKETNISEPLELIQNALEGMNLGAIVLASDGLYNTGNNPTFSVGKFTYPVYTVALGDTNRSQDALIQKVNVNNTAYINNRFPVDLDVMGYGLKGKSSTAVIKRDGKKIAEQSFLFKSDRQLLNLHFLLDADKEGLNRYEITLTPISGEASLENNIAPFVIDVLSKREKILILAAAPHPDLAALKQAIDGNLEFESEIKMAQGFTGSLKQYGLLILHQVDGKGNEAKTILSELKTSKIPVWQFSNKYLWANPGLNISESGNLQNECEAVANDAFGLFAISNDLKNYISEFPALLCPNGQYQISNGISSLITQKIGMVKTNHPILSFSESSGEKCAFFCGEGLWRWKLQDFAEHENNTLFNELIQKTIQYLSIKSEKSFFRVKSRRIHAENEPIIFEAEAYNPSYQLINEPDVNLLITDSLGKQYNYTFSKTSDAYRLDIGNYAPGKYTYSAATKINNQIFSSKGEFVITPLMAEFASLPADHGLLYRISGKTGGKLFYPLQLDSLSKTLLHSKSFKELIHEQKEVLSLIHLKWIFFLLLLALSIEWFIRKYNGLT